MNGIVAGTPLPTSDRGSITTHDISRLGAIAGRESGIVLGPDKADFLIARLGRLVEESAGGSFRDFCEMLEDGRSDTLVRRFLEAITTHTTSFFRERGQFDWLHEAGFQMLGEGGAGRARDLVFWSAACSTGQELYTALLQAKASARGPLTGLRVRGVGTDLSQSVVDVARRAVYDRVDINGIPVELRREHLLSSKANDGRYRIGPEIRARTEWRTANLTKPRTLAGIDADVVFLRNVLIYFDTSTQGTVLRNVLSRLRPGGFLLTGHSETASARALGLEVIRPTIYRKETS